MKKEQKASSPSYPRFNEKKKKKWKNNFVCPVMLAFKYGQKMAALNKHCFMCWVFLGCRSLTSLWCKASFLGLLLLHWCCLTSLRLLAHDERTGSPIHPYHGGCVCVCPPPVAEKAGGQILWECLLRIQEPLYPEPLRLRADGQPHTHRRLGHQRLSVGWAANEVWRDWLV